MEGWVKGGKDIGSLCGAYASIFHWLCLLKLLIPDYYKRLGDTPWPNSRIRRIKAIRIHYFSLHCQLWFLSTQWGYAMRQMRASGLKVDWDLVQLLYRLAAEIEKTNKKTIQNMADICCYNHYLLIIINWCKTKWIHICQFQ